MIKKKNIIPLKPNRFGYVTLRDIAAAGKGSVDFIRKKIESGELPMVRANRRRIWIRYEDALKLHGSRKISLEQAEEIRALAKERTLTKAEIAQRFGIHPSYVTYIVQGKRRSG